MDRETVITHLQIIHTWAEFARERDLQFFTAKHLKDIAQWADDALELLKEQKEEKERNSVMNWIKCEDKMPKERDSIFAKFKGTDKYRNPMFEKSSEDVRIVEEFEDGTRRVHHSYTVDGKWDIEKKTPKRTVTHWMPNPELPE